MDTPEEEISILELFQRNGLSLDDCVRFPDEGEDDPEKLAAQQAYLHVVFGKSRKVAAYCLNKKPLQFSTRDMVINEIAQGNATIPFYVHAEARYYLLRESEETIGGRAKLEFEHTFPEGFLEESVFWQFLSAADYSGFQRAYEMLIEVGRIDPAELPKTAQRSMMTIIWLKRDYLERLQPKAEYVS